MQKTFVGGVHPESHKELTEKCNISSMPVPKTVYVSLSQHLGKPAVAVVEAGAEVKTGQLIASADGAVSAGIFSPCCGTVKSIEERTTPLGKAQHIVIENNGSDEVQRLNPLKNPTGAEILKRIEQCGIVGMGGAGFPTAVKLKPAEKIEYFIINAAECEPYITCDYRIMLEYTENFLKGALYLAKAVGLDKIYIGIEDNKPDAVTALKEKIAAGGYNAEVVSLKVKYPQGAEKQLIYSITGRKVPAGGLPSAVGAIVNNVHTALSTYLAVNDGQPLYKRIMTVTGGGIKNPANLWVSVGTTYADVIEYLGGLDENKPTLKLISGGPMMGITVSGDHCAVTKTTSCLLLLGADEAFTGQPGPCINCGKCARSCPMKLMPMYIDSYILAGEVGTAVKYGANSCIECGCCAYVCPAKRPLVQSIKLAKKKFKEKKA